MKTKNTTLSEHFLSPIEKSYNLSNVQIYCDIISIASPLRINIPTIIAMSAHKENDNNYKNYDQDTTHRSCYTTN